MKKLATGILYDLGSDLDVEPKDQIPFLGFIAGTVLSMALWVGIALAFWVVHR